MNVPGGVRRLSCDLLYRGRVLALRRETIVEPAGVRTTREIVVHPGSVVLLPVLRDGRVVLVRQYRHAAGARLWELVAGTLEPGERPLTAARRELAEETGYGARHLRLIFSFFPSPGFLTEKMHLIEARSLTAGAPRPEADEQIEVAAFAPGELRRMIRSRKLVDGKTLIGILWHFGRLGVRI
jgi:ADP-ribose pyrophosphatase